MAKGMEEVLEERIVCFRYHIVIRFMRAATDSHMECHDFSFV